MLQAQQLSCRRNTVDLFRNLTFYLQAGQWLYINGPNGSGKSSLLKIFLGLLPSQTGKIFWEKREICFPDPAFLQEVHYLGHKKGIQSRLTPRENLGNWLKINTVTRSKTNNSPNFQISQPRFSIEFVLEQWGLLKLIDIPCEQLSQGQCQRLALARLGLSAARLWVLDEPCTALDSQGVDSFEVALQQHLAKGGLAMVASHTPLTQVFATQMVDLKC